MSSNNYNFFKVNGSSNQRSPATRQEVEAAARRMGNTTPEQVEARLYGLPSVPLIVPSGRSHKVYNRELTAEERAQYEPPIGEGRR